MTNDRMQKAFQHAKEEALKKRAESITALYQEKTVVDYRFDAFQFWGHMSLPQQFADFFDRMKPETEHILSGRALFLDGWLRGLLTLTKEQALELGRLVEEWNATWEYPIASRLYDGDPMEYYNAFSITFMPATGTEHTISAGVWHEEAWQWHG